MYPPPQVLEAELFAKLPESFRRHEPLPERAASGRAPLKAGCFLEGPSFDRQGNLYVVDVPFGRIFRFSPQGECQLVKEYDGEPNGLCIHKDGSIYIADHAHGILRLDAASGEMRPIVARYLGERFKGPNDLMFASNGDLYFTDQGQSDLDDPSGRVFRFTGKGALERLIDCAPSPNGLTLNLTETQVFLAVTRANAVWRLPMANGQVVRLGLYIQMSGGSGPDGMALDEKGGLVVAHPLMGAAWIFSPRGEPLYRINAPHGDMVTNVAFGWPDRNMLYITEAETGSVLRVRVPVAGRVLFSHL